MRRWIAIAACVALGYAFLPAYGQEAAPGMVCLRLQLPSTQSSACLAGVFTQTLTPTATAATIGIAEQTFTVTGAAFLTTDKIVVTGPAPTALCPMTGARATAATTLQLDFDVMTAVACTPVAGSYAVFDWR